MGNKEFYCSGLIAGAYRIYAITVYSVNTFKTILRGV